MIFYSLHFFNVMVAPAMLQFHTKRSVPCMVCHFRTYNAFNRSPQLWLSLITQRSEIRLCTALRMLEPMIRTRIEDITIVHSTPGLFSSFPPMKKKIKKEAAYIKLRSVALIEEGRLIMYTCN